MQSTIRENQIANPAGAMSRLNTTFTFLLSVVGSVWIFAIMVLVCVDITMRNILNAPISGVAEFIALSVPACVFLQLPSAIAQRRLMRAEMAIEALEGTRPRLAALLNAVFWLIGMLVFWKILVWAWPDFDKALSSGEFAGSQGAYMIPVWPFKLTLIVGTALGFLQFVRQFVVEAMTLFKPAPAGTRDDVKSLLLGAVFLASVGGFVAFMFIVEPRPLEVGIYCLIAMLALVLLGMPIALVLMSLSYIGIWIARSGEFMAVNTLGLAASSAVSSYEFGVIPLFIMMGLVLEKADVGRDAFSAAASLLRRLRGGLGIATVFANAIFASIVGSSIASAAVFSRIAVPEMVAQGYTKRFSVGCVAGSSVLGMLIPPSLLLIIYGLIAEESVGKLFIAGVIPGIILALAFALAIYAMTWLMPRFIGDARIPEGMAGSTPREIFFQLGPIVLLVVLVIGGIYGGFFTPTEAAAAGTAFAFIIALVKRRLSWDAFKSIVLESGYVSAAILFLIVAANLYTRQVALTGIPSKLANWVSSAGLEMGGFLAVYFVILLLLGMILDSVSIMLIMLPIMMPILDVLGGDKIWFGVITVIVVEIGLLTPPFGLSVYVVKSVLPKDFVSLPTIFAGALPFVLIMVLVSILLMAVPDLSLWLVRL
jgi:tripartite ATP-independent transporter DctM subunit